MKALVFELVQTSSVAAVSACKLHLPFHVSCLYIFYMCHKLLMIEEKLSGHLHQV